MKLYQNQRYFQKRELLDQKFNNISNYLVNIQTELEHSVSLNRKIGWNNYGLTKTLNDRMEEITVLMSAQGSREQAAYQDICSLTRVYLLNPSSELADRINSLFIRYFPFLRNDEAARPLAVAGLSGEVPATLMLHYELFTELVQLNSELGYTFYDGHKGALIRYTDIISEETKALSELSRMEIDTSVDRLYLGTALMILAGLLVFIASLYYLSRSVYLPLDEVRNYLTSLARGKHPSDLQSLGNDEITEMAGLLNIFSQSLRDKAEFARDIKQGKESITLQPLGPDDQLANALIEMGEHLKAAESEDRKHQEASEKRRWTNEGVARFGEILRSHSTHLEDLADDLVRNLVKYLNASLGGLFLSDQDDDNKLNLIAAFAYDKKKYIQSSYLPGEGLIGTCAIEKQKIFLTDIPDNYIKVTSGIGESSPRSLILVPLKLEEEVLGVIELASVHVFREHEIEFIERIADSIASTIAAVKMNIQTSRLLEQSQKQAREMAEQEEKMRQNVEQLQAAQEESARKESEITGILNAIQHSALVAEYDMDEKLLTINDKFLILLETQRDHILGRRLNEIIGISRHTDAYKQLWASLKEGETVSNVEKIKLVNSKEIWLRQTYTPIPDKQGSWFKVLNIATDITETISQQESIEKQANEISRANIEMKSFNEAVDFALLKCVFAPSGQIIELNENFEKVTGYSAKEMIGKNNRIFLQKTEKEQFDRLWEDILKDKPYSGVIRRTKPTGEEVWIMSTFTPVKDESGNIYKVYYLGQDITERKLKYQLLEDANREIERLKKALEGTGTD
jgi:methyl-accepting chemotaxis protein